MKKWLILLTFLFALLISEAYYARSVSAEVIGADNVMNGLITQQLINQTQKQQISGRSSSNESVDPATGALEWKIDNIHLPGREGLDLNIGVLYQSNQAFSYTKQYNSPGIKIYNYLLSRYDLGQGWSFRFPSVQLVDGYIYYHNGEGAIYRVDLNATGAADSYTHLIGYQGKDLHFEQDTQTQFSNGQSVSSYYLEYASKNREYFASDGRLLGIVDRYGNKVTFYHQDRQLYDGQTNKVISSIVDTLGRTITFSYEGSDIVVTVKDSNGITSQSVVYGRQLVSYTGDYASNSYDLRFVQNQIGEKTYFEYEYKMADFDYYRKLNGPNAGSIPHALLKSVTYPTSKTNYDYVTATRNLGTSGFAYEFCVYNRSDQIIKNNLPTGDFNHITYDYFGDYTGNPTYTNANNLPIDFTFAFQYTIKSNTDTNGLHKQMTFNGLKQQISEEVRTLDYERKVTTVQAFHPTFTYLPTIIQEAEYGSWESDTTNKLYIHRAYTALGSLQSETKPLTLSQINDISTRNKYTTTYTYEPSYNQIQTKSWFQSASDASPLTENYTYDTTGRLKSYTNPKGEVINSCYDIIDSNGTLSSNCLGGTIPLAGKVQKATVTKDLNNGRISKDSTIFGAETNYAYPSEISSDIMTQNDSGQAVTQTIKKNLTYYPGTGKLKDSTDGNGNKTAYSYDLLGRELTITYPTFTNADGQKYTAVDAYQYSNSVLGSSVITENFGMTTFKVRSYRQYRNVSNSNLISISYQDNYYDGLGNLRLSQIYDAGTSVWNSTQFHYDDLSRVSVKQDPTGNTSSVLYDDWGRQKELSDPYGNLYRAEYKFKAKQAIQYFVAASEVASYRANPNQNQLKSSYIEQDYDQWGRLVTKRTFKDINLTQPLTELFTYDIQGNIRTYIDPKRNLNSSGVTKSYTYDALNRLFNVTDALGQITSYAYDATGNIQQVSMQATAAAAPTLLSTKQFNEVGAIVQSTNPNNQSESYTYNQLGLVNKQTDRNGAARTYQYDEQYRTTIDSITLNGNILTSKSIVGKDNILTDVLEVYQNGIKTSSMTTLIDPSKLVTGISLQSSNYTSNLSLKYDQNQRISRMSTNNSFHVNYHYDKERMEKVQIDGQSAANSSASANVVYEYYANGQIKNITYPTLSDGNVLQVLYTYDHLNRLATVTNKKGAAVLSAYAYAYDDNGNIISKTETVNQITQTSTYTYDSLNRIKTSANPNGTIITYSYDLRGNRSAVQNSPANVVSLSVNYTYDLLNRLASISNDQGTTTIEYAANNLRYKKKSGSRTIQYHYNLNGEVIAESNADNLITTNYIRGDRLLVKQDVGSPVKYYYLYNGHKDVVQIVDSNGNLVNSYQYDEWGNILSRTEGIANSFKYAGEQHDDETGFYYLRARYYDPSVGRFINQDTYEGDITNPLSLNLYTYCHNSPLGCVDPSGHAAKDARYSQNQVDYLNNLVSASGNSWAQQQINEGRFYVDPNEPGVAYTVGEMDGGTPRFGTPGYDWTGEAMFTGGATAAVATCVYSCAALIAAGDVATMGTAITSGTVVAAKSVSLGARAWNATKNLVGKGENSTTLYRSVSESELSGINANKIFDAGNNMDGKWMATTFDDAVAWGKKMDGGNTRIISINLPSSSLSSFYHVSKLDGIGPAYYAEIDALNSAFIKVTVVK
jgi:RHS repeat-associated protein